MDKRILDALYKKGFLTVKVDADKYKDVDELIKSGVITFPGIKPAIDKLIATLDDVEIEEPIIDEEPKDIKDDEEVKDTKDGEDTESTTKVDEPVVDEEKEVEIVVDDLVDDTIIDEPTKKTSKKS